MQRRRLDLRGVVDEIVFLQPLLRVRSGLRRYRLRRRCLLAWHVALQHLGLRHRPDWRPGRAIEGVDPALLRRRRQHLPPLSVHRDVEQVGRHRRVVVPDVVMDHLEVPTLLAGLHVERHDAVAVEVVTVPMPAVLVAERHADRDIDETQRGIRGIRRPRVVLADTRRADFGSVLPGIRPFLTLLRDQVEFPQLFAGANVEPANPSGKVAQARRIVAVNVRAADDDDVANHDRG